jgi:DNA-binding NarL/FixJ family response regulator
VGELKTKRGRFIIIARGSAGEAERDPSQRSVEVLTKRELQIATLVAEGRVNKEIAGQLGISEWTVSTHLRRMFAKLCVDSRAALVFRCFGRNHFRGAL